MFISCFYRPPLADISYYDSIVDTFEKVSKLDKYFIVLGNLNYHYMLDETIYDYHVYMLADMFLLTQLVSLLTKVTKNSSSLLYVILTSDNDKHISTHVYKTSLSDKY